MPSLKKSALLTAFVLLAFQSAYAAQFYKHIPHNSALTATLSAGDRLIVDYDISEKNSISCTSTQHLFVMDFTYKGHQKSAALPVVLESSHVPEKDHEALADVSGQFSVYMDKNADSKSEYDVSCRYVELG